MYGAAIKQQATWVIPRLTEAQALVNSLSVDGRLRNQYVAPAIINSFFVTDKIYERYLVEAVYTQTNRESFVGALHVLPLKRVAVS